MRAMKIPTWAKVLLGFYIGGLLPLAFVDPPWVDNTGECSRLWPEALWWPVGFVSGGLLDGCGMGAIFLGPLVVALAAVNGAIVWWRLR